MSGTTRQHAPAKPPIWERGIRLSYPRESDFYIIAWASLLAAVLVYELFNYFTVVYIGSFNVSPKEITLLLCLPSLFIAVRYAHPRRLSTILVALLALLILIATVRGIGVNGSFKAIFGLRAGYLLFLISFTIVALTPLTPERTRQVLLTLTVFAGLFAVLVLVRQVVGSGFADHRALSSKGGIILAQASVLAFGAALARYTPRDEAQKWLLAAVLFAVTLFLTGQRTAFLAGMLGVGVVLSFSASRYRWPILIGLSAFVTGVLLILSIALVDLGAQGVIDLMPQFIQDAFGQKTTLDWRVAQWQGHLEKFWSSSTTTHLLGTPFGSPSEIFLKGLGYKIKNISIHSHYVKTLIDLGMIGIGVFVLTMLLGLGKAVRRMIGADTDPYFTGAAQIGLIVVLLVFSYGYWLHGVQGAILGLLVANRSRKRHASA